MSDLIALMRPSQWVKNAFVLAAAVFSMRFLDPEAIWRALMACALFCLASSAAYALNDVIDAEGDRAHPLKRSRPVAAGRVTPRGALLFALTLAALALGGSMLLGLAFTVCLGAFLALQVGYSLVFKQLVMVDAVALAAGFMLRVGAGALAVGTRLSGWLFLCTFLLALFLALAKRRQEIALLRENAALHRNVLEQYNASQLDTLITVTGAGAVFVYIQYTLSPEVAAKLGTGQMHLTVPFVVFGVFRYLFLIYGHNKGASPTDVLLDDRPLQLDVAAWVVTVLMLLYW